jgi:excisionase family DNA binding protein
MGKKEKKKNAKKYLSMMEAADYLSLKPSYLYQLTSKRLIPHSKVGRLNIFNSFELDCYIEQHKVQTNSEIKQQAINDYVSGRVSA